MKTETKINVYNSLFISVLFGVAFTILGGLILSGSIDWKNFLPEAIFAIAVGFAIGMVIPGGKWGFALASKVTKPGTLLFNLVMYTLILIIMLTIMCPVLTLFIGCVVMGAACCCHVGYTEHIFTVHSLLSYRHHYAHAFR
jgi:hypothetical protein